MTTEEDIKETNKSQNNNNKTSSKIASLKSDKIKEKKDSALEVDKNRNKKTQKIKTQSLQENKEFNNKVTKLKKKSNTTNNKNNYTKSSCKIKQNRAETLARHNEAIHLANKEMLKQEKLGNTYSVNSNLRNTSSDASTDISLKGGAGGKFFSDCPKLSSNAMQDKFFVITKSAGEDYNLSYSELVNSMKKDLLRPSLQEQIGNLRFNTSNHLNLRDNPTVRSEYFEYLMLDGRELKTKDYPELAEFFYAGNNATFNLPDMKDGTLRNIKRGSGRANSSWQEDALQRITGRVGWAQQGLFTVSDGVFSGIKQVQKVEAAVQESTNFNMFSNVSFDNSRVARTDSETRMKNMGVQVYICAKVLI